MVEEEPEAEADVAALLPHLRLPASIPVLQVAVQAADAVLERLQRRRRFPRGSWFTLLMRRQPCLRLLRRLRPQRQRPAELPRQVAEAVAEQAVELLLPVEAVEEQAAAVALRLPLCRFPELDRNSPERRWSRGTRLPGRNAGTPITAPPALTRAARSQPPATSYSPAREATLRSIAPIPASSFWIWTSTSTRWGRP